MTRDEALRDASEASRRSCAIHIIYRRAHGNEWGFDLYGSNIGEIAPASIRWALPHGEIVTLS